MKKNMVWRSRSIFSKVTFSIIIIIIIQTVFLIGSLIVGGVLDQGKENAYQSFFEKVNNRKDYVQREMKNKWTNMDPYLASISKILSGDEKSAEYIFDESIEELLKMLRATQTTGVYMILKNEDPESDKYPAVYLRDYDPLANSEGDEDIYMICGPSELAKKLKIPLDQTWQYNLKLTESNGDFFFKPFLNAPLTTKASLLGYWSKPFIVSEDDLPVITYSIPLFNLDGDIEGVIGIEITLNYLSEFFPASELQPRDSLGYMIAYKDDVNKDILPIFMNGALQKRMIHQSEPLILKEVDRDRNIFELENHNGNENIFSSVEKIGLYQFNTPFENEEWFIIGLIREDYLLNYVNTIKKILFISLCASLILGLISGLLISYQLTKPIRNLAEQVIESDKTKIMNLKSTGLIEIDQLSNSIEVANKMMLDSASRLSRITEMFEVSIGAFEINSTTGKVFITGQFFTILELGNEIESDFKDKDKFLNFIKSILKNPEEEEEDVYILNPSKWVKIKTAEVEDLVYGIVMDVTSEILEKNQIKKDRDLDALTKLLNRKGFQRQFEVWRKKEYSGTSALLMFDLDNLKIINDTYGHKWGDQYITQTVARLKKITDDDHKILGRRSGDEFVLLLYDFESKDSIRKCISDFHENLSKETIKFPDGTDKFISISAGLMWIDHFDLSYDELLHYADEALYESKRNNRGSFSESRY